MIGVSVRHTPSCGGSSLEKPTLTSHLQTPDLPFESRSALPHSSLTNRAKLCHGLGVTQEQSILLALDAQAVLVLYEDFLLLYPLAFISKSGIRRKIITVELVNSYQTSEDLFQDIEMKQCPWLTTVMST